MLHLARVGGRRMSSDGDAAWAWRHRAAGRRSLGRSWLVPHRPEIRSAPRAAPSTFRNPLRNKRS